MASEETKLYFSIREVSRMLGVKPHVLRYWETQFKTLRPKKNRAGNRVYRQSDIDLLRAIKELLYDRKYTIAGARRKLLDDRKEQAKPAEPKAQLDLEYLSPKYRKRIREIRSELVKLRDWLDAQP